MKKHNMKEENYICNYLTDSKYDVKEQQQVLATLCNLNINLDEIRVELVKWPSYSIHKYYLNEELICKIYDGEIQWNVCLTEQCVC